jgi:AraC-like DNA-binding protein
MTDFRGIGLCAPYASSKPHSHPRWEIGIYTAGAGTAWIGSRAIAVGTGVVVCYPPDITHFERSEQPLSGYFATTDEMPGIAPGGMEGHDDEDGSCARLAALVTETFMRDRALGDPLVLSLFEALTLLVRRRVAPGRVPHPLVERLRRALHEGMGDAAFSVARALAALPMSRDHLRRRFADETGRTPIRYLVELRIGRARELLRMGRSVKQVAEEVGFTDPYYFSRVFRSIAGRPPSEDSPRR